MLSEEKRSHYNLFIITNHFIFFISPKANTHIIIGINVCSLIKINLFGVKWMICIIPCSFIKSSVFCCYKTCCCILMVIGCFRIKFPTNDVVTVTHRTSPLFIPTFFVCTAPTFQLSAILITTL
jgi:hypothetical protein